MPVGYSKMKLLLFILSVFILGCNKPTDQSDHTACLTKFPGDNNSYKLLKHNLYIGKDGMLYDKKIKIDKSDPSYCYSVFYYKYIDIHYNDSIVQIPLDSIIDINTYIAFDSSVYSRDKYHCYYFYNNSDGGFRFIIDNADPATFAVVKNTEFDAEDKNHKYKCGEIVN